MAQIRHEHARAKLNTVGALSGASERHPDVGVERGRVVAPGPSVAEPLGEDNVFGGVEAGGERAGDLHRASPFVKICLSMPCTALLQVAVGMPVTRHPPHRSRRAALPHRAPALGRNAQTLRGIRMHNVGFWKPLGSEWVHPLPGHAMTLAAPPYCATPVAEYTFPEYP